MIEPGSMLAVGGKIFIGKHVAESVLSGNDPSLMPMVVALAFPAVNPPVPMPSRTGECIVARKEIGEFSTTKPNVREYAFLEQYVDSKYMNHGNWEDALGQLKNGELTFDSFVLAMVDIVDALTLGLFKPQLLEVKINPHLKAREIVYRAEVSYDTPEKSVQETVADNVKKLETINTQRRIMQISRISFEISPESFQKADLSFAESVAKMKSAEIAERSVIFARLDTLTEEDLKFFGANGLKEIQSQRVQSVETQEDLLASGKRDISELVASGGTLVDDRENKFSTIKISENSSVSNLSEEQISKTGIRVNEPTRLSAAQKTTTLAQQKETIDHLNERRVIKSSVAEQIDWVQVTEESSGRRTHEGVRLREAAGQSDIFSLKNVSVDELVASGGTLVDDRENKFSTIKISENSSVSNLSEEQISKTGIRVNEPTRLSAAQKTTTLAQQKETIDHLNERRVIKSSVAEQIDWVQVTEESSGRRTHEGVRLREAAGQSDIFSLKNVSVDEFVASGAKLLSDKARVQDTIVAVDISESGETINFVNSEKKTSWLVRESDVRRNRAISVDTQTRRTAKQVAEYDYLANSKEILDATVQDEVVTTTTVKDIVESKTHWNFFGWNAAGFLGENIKTEITPTVTTETYIDGIELAAGQDIFSNLNATKDTLVAQGGRIADHSSDIRTEQQTTITQCSFEEGTISYVPFVGGLGHLASKAGLGGELTLQDAFWAAADVAEIATTVIAIAAAAPTAGVSVATQVVATTAKTAAKVAAKAAIKAAAKTAVKTSGKAVVKGAIHIAGKSSAMLAAKTSTNNLAGIVVKQTGRIALKNGGHAGAKAAVAKSGSIVRYKNLPKSNGNWLGIPGNSKWMPDPDRIPSRLNPRTKSMGQIIAENDMQKGIPFKQGKIDLYAASRGTVKIDDYTLCRPKNFAQADSKLADAIRSGNANPEIQNVLQKMKIDSGSITKGDIKKLRAQEGYTWHERADMKTLDLIKTELHANIPHSGGICALKDQLAAAQSTGALR